MSAHRLEFNPGALRTLRLERGWSPTELAAAAGCVAESVRAWEAGTSVPSLRSFFALADALAVPLGDLVVES